MTMFDKFCVFIARYMLFPLIIAPVSLLVSVIVVKIAGEWATWVYAIPCAAVIVAVLWVMAFLAALSIKVIKVSRFKREYRRRNIGL